MENTNKEPAAKPPAPTKPKPSFIKSPVIPLIIVVGCLTAALLNQTGYIDLPHFNLNVNPTPAVKDCPTKLNPPCHSVQNGIGVYGGIVPFGCKCPDDTDFELVDRVTPGGPYNICTCR